MNILYISPWEPSLKSGGGRHCYANLKALCSYKDSKIDYIGPYFNKDSYFSKNNNLQFIFSRNYTIYDKSISFIYRASSSLFGIFNEFKNKYSLNKYDLIFIESSRCGFLFKYLDKNIKKILNIHNVEYDYLSNNRKGIQRLILRRNIVNSEKECINLSDIILIMHRDDLLRLKKLYNFKNDKKFLLHPVCSFNPKYNFMPFNEREKVILFIGSLDAFFNEFSLKKFIEICWGKLENCGYKLRVAGKNPSGKLRKFLKKHKNIDLIANPIEMEPIINNSRLMILPDVFGSGMKSRIAEALSYGVPIIGTKEGLKGYEDIASYGYKVDNIIEMETIIKKLLKNEKELGKFSLNAFKSWEKNLVFRFFVKEYIKFYIIFLNY